MVDMLQGIGDKIVAVILAASALANGVFAVAQTTIAPSPSQNIASIRNIAAPPNQEQVQGPIVVPEVMSPTTTQEITGSLPIVIFSPRKTATAAKTKPATTTARTAKTAAQNIAASAITAQWLLDNTKFSFKQKRDGNYEAVFIAKTGGNDLAWGVEDAFIGGSASIPKFAFSISCDPPLEVPPPDSPDKARFFTIRTSYDCTVGFAATSGNDQRLRSKNLHFETGAGRLVVAPPSAMNTVLANDTNSGGFVFTNQDTRSFTITKLVLDLSYTALSILNGPLVLRITDPLTETSLFEYHMENLAADPSSAYTHTAAGIEVPISFTIGPSSQKLLPIRLLGVHWMSISGIDPTAAITLRALTIDPDDVQTVFNAPRIRWSCVVALGAYDPNATSGPFATGEACR